MILRRLILWLVAAAAFAASAAVLIVALAFAFYALVEPALGRAGAAGAVAGATALLIALLAIGVLLATRRPKTPPLAKGSEKVAARLIEFVRQKPVMAVSAAVGAGIMAIRNPGYLGSAVRAFFDGRPVKRR